MHSCRSPQWNRCLCQDCLVFKQDSARIFLISLLAYFSVFCFLLACTQTRNVPFQPGDGASAQVVARMPPELLASSTLGGAKASTQLTATGMRGKGAQREKIYIYIKRKDKADESNPTAINKSSPQAWRLVYQT